MKPCLIYRKDQWQLKLLYPGRGLNLNLSQKNVIEMKSPSTVVLRAGAQACPGDVRC